MPATGRKQSEESTISDQDEKGDSATALDIVQAAVVVVALLVLAWFMESGNRTASVVWGLVSIAGSIWLYFTIRKQKTRDTGSENE